VSVSFSERLADKREPFLFSWMSIASAQLAGQLARTGLDGVCIDMQHGMVGFTDANRMVGAIVAAGKPAIVRILWNEPGLVGQVLDAGVSAVIAPMVNSRAEAEALVKAAKYPPIGMRSWGGYTMLQTSGMNAADYLKDANRLTNVFAMIETREALDALDDIASVPGLDGLFVGPSDLSIALSNGAELNRTSKATLEAMARVKAACDKHNLIAGAFAGPANVIKTYVGLGFTFLAGPTDVDLVNMGAAQLITSVKAV
jgi:4-hydroxy-2-oxoheptanedioate aldolase